MQIRKILAEVDLEVLMNVVGIIAGILLGIMAIIVSIQANRISKQQAKLAERQTTLAELELRPRIQIEWKSGSPKVSSRQETCDYVEVWNRGKPLLDFYIRQFSFLEVWRSSWGSGVYAQEVKLVPAYYLHDRFFSGSQEGHLASLYAYNYQTNGFTEEVNLTSELVKKKEGLEVYEEFTWDLRPRVFLEISYTDVLGERHREIREASMPYEFYGADLMRVVPEDALSFFYDYFYSGGIAVFDIDKLPAEMIFEKWEEWPGPPGYLKF